MPSRAIRSTAHRQILTHLRPGPSTMTELAQAFDMRMPHASLACRQLTEMGLIARDITGGVRNAPIYLTQQGFERLTQDGLSKLKQYEHEFREKDVNVVLRAEATNVLVGYTQMPPSPLVFVQNPTNATKKVSSGNGGGVWLLLEIDSIEWYSLADVSLTTPPLSSQSVTLEDFGKQVEKIGLVRGEVFEVIGKSSLVEGQAFSTHIDPSVPSPKRLQQGEISLGNISGTSLQFNPPHGFHAYLPSPLERTLVLENLADGALEVSDRLGVRKRILPLEVLRYWLSLRHPRMSKEKLQSNFSELCKQLEGDAHDLPPSLRRDLTLDFGDVTWVSSAWGVGHIDIYGMSIRGVESVVDDVLQRASVPFIIDWPFDNSLTEVKQRALDHPKCRVWIGRKDAQEYNSPQLYHATSSHHFASIEVRLGRKGSFLVDLASVQRTTPTVEEENWLPRNVNELLSGKPSREHTHLEQFTLEGEARRRMEDAVRCFPVGNEHLANEWEGIDPLSSWIISPPAQRPSRFVRIHQRLGHGWVELMPVVDVPLSHMPSAIAGADERWQKLAFHRLRNESQLSPAILVNFVRGLEEKKDANAYATCLLAVLNPYQAEHTLAFDSALEKWRYRPMCVGEILRHIFSFASQDPTQFQLLYKKMIAFAQQQPRNSLMFLWAEVLESSRSASQWTPERQRVLMEHLPAAWWSSYAEEWLLAQLNSVSGRAWLRDHSLPWFSQLFGFEGQLNTFPGMTRPHHGFRLNSEQLIAVKLLGDGEGTTELNDIYEAVYAKEMSLPPPSLKSHPFAAWLAYPLHEWPHFDESVMDVGDARIGRLLFAMSFQQQAVRDARH